MSITITYSNLNRLMACPGSFDLIRENHLPKMEDRSDADEGIKAHALAVIMFTGKQIDSDDDDMFEAVKTYVDDVKSAEKNTGFKAIIEGYAGAPSVHKQLGGVPDAVLYDQDNDVLYVWDFKYGHKFVDEYENWQLVGGAAGAIDNRVGITDDTDVVLMIVQPRYYSDRGPIRRWKTTVKELRNSYFLDLKERINHVLDTTQAHYCRVSPACYHCPAAHVCPTLHNSASYAKELAYENIQVNMTDEALACELRAVDDAMEVLKNRRAGLAEDATYRISTGKRIPGYSVEQGYSNARWKYPLEILKQMAQLLGGATKFTEEKLLTPAQVKKQKTINPETIDSWVERVPTAKTLKPNNINLSRIFK